MSAPSSSGRWSAGDANVLSMTSSGRARPACAARSREDRPPTAAMSVTLSSGFDGVSSQTSRVRSLSPSHSASGSPGEVHVPGRDPAPARWTRSK